MHQSQFGPGAFRAPHLSGAKTPEQHLGGIVFVVAIHIAIFYALLSSLGVVPIPKTPHALQVFNLAPPPKVEAVPPPPPPVIEVPRVENIITPEIHLEYVPPQVTAITPPPAPPTEAVLPPPAARFTPPRAIAVTHTTPDYPPLSRRLGEQGSLRLKLTISPEGLVEDAVVVNSSGHTRLDDAAVQWVKAHWRYEPARQGSRAVVAMLDAVVVFQLR